MAALESACTGAASAVTQLERALVSAARDQARELAPLAEDARRLTSDLARIGRYFNYLLQNLVSNPEDLGSIFTRAKNASK